MCMLLIELKFLHVASHGDTVLLEIFILIASFCGSRNFCRMAGLVLQTPHPSGFARSATQWRSKLQDFGMLRLKYASQLGVDTVANELRQNVTSRRSRFNFLGGSHLREDDLAANQNGPGFMNPFKGDEVRLKRGSNTRRTGHHSQCRAAWQELAGVVVFSALPFTIVKGIANSSIGEQLQQNMLKTKAAAQAAAGEAREAQSNARNASVWYREGRAKWLGPMPYDYPDHLRGEAPGDYGFDILGLARNPTNFDKYFNFEILHARWAMLAALGVVIPELLDRFGGVQFSEPVWWKVGYAKLQGDTLDYLGIPGLHIAGAQGVLVIAFCQVILMLGPEYARYCGIEALEPLGIFLPGDINYPGGALFDPLGLTKDAAAFEDLKVKEMKNGRLAMVAWLGFYVQALVTQKGPIDNLFDFVEDPLHQNLFASVFSKH